MAASFADQDELVKLQLLSLAVKLSITQPDTLPVCKYVLSLARYDVSYDVRDRARLLRRFIDPEKPSLLAQYAEHIFCPDKPKPTIQSNFKDREQYTVGSLSQYLGTPATGYRPLPDPPQTALAADLRDAPAAPPPHTHADAQKNKTFYSEPDSDGSGSTASSSSSGSEEDSSDEEENEENDAKKEKPHQKTNNYKSSQSGTSDSESDSESSGSGSDSGSSAESSDHQDTKDTGAEAETKNSKAEKSNLELLLELDEVASSLPTMTPTLGGLLSPPPTGNIQPLTEEEITAVGPSLVASSSTEVVSRLVSRGLSASARWPRAPHLYSPRLCALELALTNHTSDEITNIRITKKSLSGSRSIHEFPAVARLGAGAMTCVTLGIDFADSIQPVEFTIASSLGEVNVSITPSVGELIRAVSMSPARWDTEHRRLRGMTECDKKATKLEDEQTICKRVFETANVAAITSTGDFLRFAGRLISSQDLVLLSVKTDADSATVTANCANMAIASMLANQIAQAFDRS